MKTLIEIITDHVHWWRQILMLAKSDLVKTYKGASLGWAWAIIKPTITIVMYYFAFTFGFRTSKPVGEYSYFLWLITGMIPWFYMQSAFLTGSGSIRQYGFLVTKIRYPISTIPTFVNLSLLIVHVALVIILLVIYMISGKMPDIYWIQLPLYTLLMFLFFCALSLFTSILSSMSKDFLNLVKSGTNIMFWMSGLLYDAKTIDNFFLRAVILYNPITFVAQGYRNCLIYKEWIWQDTRQICYFFVLFAVVLVLAVATYKKLKKDLPDVL